MVTIEDNAKKFVRVASFYPDHKLEQIIALFDLPMVDINCAIWRAKDFGWLTIDEKKQSFALAGELPELPDGELTEGIRTRLLYALKKVNENENDMEEVILSQWFAGYPGHDMLLVIKDLLEKEVIATYTIHEDSKEFGKNDYVYYTLAENRAEEWGRKQFKRPAKVKVK